MSYSYGLIVWVTHGLCDLYESYELIYTDYVIYELIRMIHTDDIIRKCFFFNFLKNIFLIY